MNLLDQSNENTSLEHSLRICLTLLPDKIASCVVSTSILRVLSNLEFRVEYRNEWKTYQTYVVPEFSTSSSIESVLTISRDITQLRQTQAAFAEAETANRMKDEFLATLSHELRTPLNPILGWTRLLRSRSFSVEKTQEALETIERSAERQSQLVEDLLDLSQIIQGQLKLSLSSVSLIEPIQAAIDTIRLSAEAKELEIETQLDPTVGYVRGGWHAAATNFLEHPDQCG